MNVTFHQQVKLSNKWIRRIKHYLNKLKEKFDHILTSDVYLSSKPDNVDVFSLRIVIGLPGSEVIYSSASNDIQHAITSCYYHLKRNLSRWKDRYYKTLSNKA